jgi:hypothetical protein
MKPRFPAVCRYFTKDHTKYSISRYSNVIYIFSATAARILKTIKFPTVRKAKAFMNNPSI